MKRMIIKALLASACIVCGPVAAAPAAPAASPPPAASAAPAAAAAARIVAAGAPLRLIRGAAVYKGVAGTVLQKDDILETGTDGAQIEAGPQAIVALGPRTKVYVLGMATDDKSGTVLVMLEGWLKVLAKSARPAAVGTPLLQMSVAAGSTVLHAGAARAELFAEEGEHIVARVDDKGKPGALLKVAAEQYAFATDTQPLKVLPRPERDFLSGMPPAFRDRLVALPRPAGPPKPPLAPVKEREVDYADVAPWLTARLQVRRNFVQRFKPRLADPAFRSALDQALGQTAEWKAALRPQVKADSTP